MLRVDVAEQLRDAGYPQNVTLGSMIYDESRKSYMCSFMDGPLAWGLLIPSTEELRKACMVRLWKVEYFPGREYSWRLWDTKRRTDFYEGKSEEELYAFFWLTINGKI